MAKLEKIKAGDVLYDVHTERAGNTKIRVEGTWEVAVISVHPEGTEERAYPHAVCRWNGNRARVYTQYDLAKLRVTPKEWVREWGGQRCYVCGAKRTDGHRDTCTHPRAVSARKRAAKDGAQ